MLGEGWGWTGEAVLRLLANWCCAGEGRPCEKGAVEYAAAAPLLARRTAARRSGRVGSVSGRAMHETVGRAGGMGAHVTRYSHLTYIVACLQAA